MFTIFGVDSTSCLEILVKLRNAYSVVKECFAREVVWLVWTKDDGVSVIGGFVEIEKLLLYKKVARIC